MTGGHDRAVGSRTVALQTLVRLARGDHRAKTLHRLRVHLRRLQAYLELVGEEANADRIARCVSRLSDLRTLQVLAGYLKARRAPKSDRNVVRSRAKKLSKKLDRKGVWKKIARCVERHALPPAPGPADWMADRLPARRRAHAEALRDLLAAAEADPRRKTLHALRLKIKTIRYQEEWAAGQTAGRTELIARLKRAQTLLGEYEERVQFRKLARRLGLRSLGRIEKDRQRARKRARAVPGRLAVVLDELTPANVLPFRRMRRPDGSHTKPAAG